MLLVSARPSSRPSFFVSLCRALAAVAVLATTAACFGQAAAPVNPAWVQASPSTSPSSRYATQMVYDAANGTVVLFGGLNGSVGLGDTWIWNGATWTQQFPTTSPSARYAGSMVYDAAHGTVLLFGGWNGSADLGDTWSWNGTNWTQLSPATSPSAREYPALVYDGATGSVLLFGGNTSSGVVADTWTWNGTTWTQLSPATSPTARRASGMAYDAATGNVVLFGGYGSNYLGDTWTWNGTTWTQLSPSNSPSIRENLTMTYDPVNRSIVLFGGFYGSGYLGDTWTWNGSTWTQQAFATNPPTRAWAMEAYDAATESLVMFGGVNSSGVLNDTWNYDVAPYFGTVAVGSSATATATFNVTTAGALGTPAVLTLGAANLDFTLGTGSTCTGSVATGTCKVNLTFTPTTVGMRMGAVELTNSSGTVIATGYLSGVGSGPVATLSPGTMTTIAGSGTLCSTATNTCGDGGQATATTAAMSTPSATAMDGAGNLYIADETDNRVRMVTAATGVISTFAGTGTACSSPTASCGDTALATAANLNGPSGVAVDGAGNVFIADTFDHRIRKVTAATGVITTFAGTGVTCSTSTAACGDGGLATASGADLYHPLEVALDGAGDVYIADYFTHRIRMVSAATGILSTVAGSGTECTAATTACGDGGVATASTAELNEPSDVAVDSAGNLYIADSGDDKIREVNATTGLLSTVAGSGAICSSGTCGDGSSATASSAKLNFPTGIAVDSAGNLYIADQATERLRGVTAATGVLSTIAGNLSASNCSPSTSPCGDGNPSTSSSVYLDRPNGVRLDGAGNIYLADSYDFKIREVTVKGGITFPTATGPGSPDSTDATETLTLNNIGSLPLTIASMANSSSSTSFTLGNPNTGGCSTAVALAAGGSCLMGETFAPVAGSNGELAGSLSVTDNSLNVAGTTQTVPLSGSTATGATTVEVAAATTTAGAASDIITVSVGYSGAVADAGAVTLSVNSSSTGVGPASCTVKGGHENCNFTYTGTALATAGAYPVVVTVAANGSYPAGAGTGTLVVLPGSEQVRRPVAPVVESGLIELKR